MKVGMIQKMVFEELDNFGNEETGPFVNDSKINGKYDVVDGSSTSVAKNCDELRAVMSYEP